MQASAEPPRPEEADHPLNVATQVKTFKLDVGQIEPVQAAIDMAKERGAKGDSVALKVICDYYMGSRIRVTPDWLVNTVDWFFKKDATGEFREKILAALTPYPESQAD